MTAFDEAEPAAGPGGMPNGMPEVALAALYARPGFRLRRAHQIALSVFAGECRAFEVTTTQYGILVALRTRPGLDQIGLAQLLGLDRSTTGMVVRLLEARGLLLRSGDRQDRRRRILNLTPQGAALLEEVEPAAERSVCSLLAPLTEREASTLGRLLDKLLTHHDPLARVPLLRGAEAAEAVPEPAQRTDQETGATVQRRASIPSISPK
ncbi:MarR family winged helix-turn-helix transcriptional regulator [Pararoseomonas indoligenes]|uniref:MarR family transcriptional regulator n=1 Tax=Roseomonas indoligenes TaxID=2820811 RepID=A0A940N122_9PROT|nr:MarR family transcriptional regulator [Pararoseomonas indoligenes]MBP0492322.1 MarR family transcriptional regulator [Pararoseomonas indoligenes]